MALTPEQQARYDQEQQHTREQASPYMGWYNLFTGGQGEQLVAERAARLSAVDESNRALAERGGFSTQGGVEVTDGFGASRVVPIFGADMREDPNFAANRGMLAQRLAGLDSRPTQTMQSAQLGSAAQMTGANINQAPQGQFRAQQMGLAQQLGAAARGEGPSAAQAQLAMATDRNMSGALAMALGARGGNQAGAMKQAMMQRAGISQQAGAQSAMLRAQEMQAAQQSLGGLLSQGRGADIGLASEQAGLNQQASMTNAGFRQAQTMQQGQFDQQTNMANLQAGIQQRQGLDDVIQRYTAMGMSADQANYMAMIQQGQFGADLAARQTAAAHGIQMQGTAQQMQLLGAGLSAAGTLGASAINYAGSHEQAQAIAAQKK